MHLGQQEKECRLYSRIRGLRKGKGYSQEAFAYHAHIDRGYMGKIERGESNITIATLSLICLALDVGMGDLTEGLPTDAGNSG